MGAKSSKEESVRQLLGGFAATRAAVLKEKPVTIPAAEKKKIVEELRKAMDPERVRDEYFVRAYYRGAAFCIPGRLMNHVVPDLVVYPKSREDIQEILKTASKYKVPVTTVGTQMVFMGTRPLKGGIVMDLMHMKQIHKVDFEHGYAVVEPGVTVEQLMEVIRPKGYMVARGTYPLSCSVLSTLTTNMVMHNMTNRMFDQVTGIEAVMSDGTIFYSGTAVISEKEHWTGVTQSFPNVSGLFRPHSATLGVITKAAIRIWPLLEETALPVFGFSEFERAYRWSHKMSKSGLVDQTMVWNWVLVGDYNFNWSDRHLDFIEARMKYYQEETPTDLNLFNCYGWAQMRGYKEEIKGGVETAKRLAREYGGTYLPDEEVKETLPGIWAAWRDLHKEFWPEGWEGPEPRLGPQSGPGSRVVLGRGLSWEGSNISVTTTGPVDEVIRMYGGINEWWRGHGYKNYRYYTRMIESGHTPFFRFFPCLEHGTPEDLQESDRIRADVTKYVLENYGINLMRLEFGQRDPDHPENVLERAKPVQRIVSVVRKEFDPENIMNPVQTKYTLL